VRGKYSGPVGERFGPTLAAEHLDSEDGLQVNAETRRQWMLAEGLWSRARKRRQHRRRRERKEHLQREIPAPAKSCELPPAQKLKGATPKRKWVPPADHPWRKLILRTAQQKAAREASREAR
jgi:hypothetical protein